MDEGRNMGRASSFLIIIVALLVVIVGGLFYLDQAISPEVQLVEKVLPNEKFVR